MNIFDLSSKTFRHLQLFNRQKSTSGLTQVEMLVTIILLGILLTIALSVYHRLMAWVRLNIATFEISQQWKNTRYQATGGGSHPLSLCMAESENQQIQVAQVQGNQCENVTDWTPITRGVSIDTANSTLRRVSGPAGNQGTIYRASWADTRRGLGGSWGQLGRITLVASGAPDKRCLFLFRVDGSWDIRQDNRCVR
ncbi:prepilin-type cleavage/methylation domain-containing protein [Microcystis aeruginosa EAWAG127a]|jgi:Tfp pilus assembly protein PilW|uniref:Prepilin-type cleavage/methylation domain-containing protein n=1 Tax=Microcystis aeruginosa EAWAG127a TaxID=2529855 RepID=A0A5J5LV39_MICAE|nr:prepilin-type cleavage/methylation domain-containing protein [Microcystis aeruginosa]KAB0241522.1 prepilin-type cleavage/methylation domain-containing protein [Microcystis aeruginosa EAWAG127a]